MILHQQRPDVFGKDPHVLYGPIDTIEFPIDSYIHLFHEKISVVSICLFKLHSGNSQVTIDGLVAF